LVVLTEKKCLRGDSQAQHKKVGNANAGEKRWGVRKKLDLGRRTFLSPGFTRRTWLRARRTVKLNGELKREKKHSRKGEKQKNVNNSLWE